MSRRSEAKKRHPAVPPETVDALFDQDPSRGAYGEWMVARVAEGSPLDRVVKTVQHFHEVKPRLLPVRRDLFQYDRLEHLEEAIRGESSQRKMHRADPGYTLLREYPNLSFYRVDSLKGMRVLGRDTTWCVTKVEYYDRYRDNVLVVVVNRLRPRRARLAKIIIVSEDHAKQPDSTNFLAWDRLKEMARTRRKRKREVHWNYWDALNQSRYDSDDMFVEVLDMIAGEEGATRSVLASALGEPAHLEVLEGVLGTLRGGVRSEGLLQVAETVTKYGLFNPLSLLTHPAARSHEVCSKVWALSTPEHLEALDGKALEILGKRPAMNVPEILDAYWATTRVKGRRKLRHGINDRLGVLLGNQSLTRATKERVLEIMRRDVLHLGEAG